MDVVVGETTVIGRVTGPESANRTVERFGIAGTDLGIPWDGGDGRVFMAFGDTYGPGWRGHQGGLEGADWRANVLAFSTSRDLENGLVLDDVVSGPDGMARQVIPSAWGREATVIPNGGIAVDGTHYVHYMSVRRWEAPGRWRTRYGGIAVSHDGGRTWTRPRAARWPNRRGRNPFQLGALTRSGEYVYLFGTTNGRDGDAYLARARPAGLLDTRQYEYWDGAGWAGRARAAAPVFTGPLGELSVAYHRYLGCWLAMHVDERRKALVLRSADTLTGPWSGGEIVVSGHDHRGIYGGYFHPWALDGPEIYYLVSLWGPYNVFLFRTRLGGQSSTSASVNG